MSKKLFFFISFSMFIICKGEAQVNTSSKLKIGLKTGLNLSTFTKDVSVFDQGNYANFQKYFRIASLIGVVTKYQVSAPFSWGAELLYNQRGSAYRQENGSVVIVTNQGTEKAYNYFKFKINYLELPLTANCNLSTHSKGTINFSIYGGLAPAIVLIRKTSYDSYDSNDNSPVANSTSESGELKDVRPFNISTVAGFEIAGKKEGSFFFNGRISNTLLPVFQKATSSDGHNMKTRMWSYTLGLGVYLDYSSK